MKIANMTKSDILARMGSEATDAEASAMLTRLKSQDQWTETTVIGDSEWQRLIADAVEQAQLVAGMRIQHDPSGQGHAWRNVNADDIPGHVQREIEGEIIDGGRDDVDDFVGSNGQHYRW